MFKLGSIRFIRLAIEGRSSGFELKSLESSSGMLATPSPSSRFLLAFLAYYIGKKVRSDHSESHYETHLMLQESLPKLFLRHCVGHIGEVSPPDTGLLNHDLLPVCFADIVYDL